jgi:hypothetical protein
MWSTVAGSKTNLVPSVSCPRSATASLGMNRTQDVTAGSFDERHRMPVSGPLAPELVAECLGHYLRRHVVEVLYVRRIGDLSRVLDEAVQRLDRCS